MPLRFLIRFIANNEQLVQKLSESYPMRKAAQVVVRTMFYSKTFLEEKGFDKKLNPEEFRKMMQMVSQTYQQKVKQVQDEIKRKTK